MLKQKQPHLGYNNPGGTLECVHILMAFTKLVLLHTIFGTVNVWLLPMKLELRGSLQTSLKEKQLLFFF